MAELTYTQFKTRVEHEMALDPDWFLKDGYDFIGQYPDYANQYIAEFLKAHRKLETV